MHLVCCGILFTEKREGTTQQRDSDVRVDALDKEAGFAQGMANLALKFGRNKRALILRSTRYSQQLVSHCCGLLRALCTEFHQIDHPLLTAARFNNKLRGK